MQMIFSNLENALGSTQADNWLECGGERVLQLQSMYPLARVLYSTNGLSSFGNVVGLCSRLALWKQSRMDFLTGLERR